MKNEKILIFGAGVIGSIYAAKIALAGYDVTILARNKRLSELKKNGLLINPENEANPIKAEVSVINEFKNEHYDYVFVTLRKDHVKDALPVLKQCNSENFVFMVNTPCGYKEWIDALGKSKIIPAFPGAGGKIENGIVHFTLTSKKVQPTTLGEISGEKTARLKKLSSILESAGFPIEICDNMDVWQKSHVAMVAAFAGGIYYDGGNNYTFAKNKIAVNQMNRALKEAFSFLHKSGIGILPSKMNIFRLAPLPILNIVMRKIFNSKWAETVISNHSLKARQEMEMLTNDFIALAENKGFNLIEVKKLIKKPSHSK